MKNTIKFMIGLAAVGLVSCEPEFDTPVDEGFYDNGDADFSTYVAVGNSLTAGYADSALYISGQENSYPNIMATQFTFVGGGEFTQPLMSDNLGGLFLNGTEVAGNRLVLSNDENGNPFPTTLEGVGTTEITTSATGPFNNMGVPGAKSFHLVAPGYGDAGGVLSGTANPYYARFATSSSATVISDAVSLNPTFFSLWIGNNDILSYATSGGSGVDQTGNLDPSTYGSNDITDPNVFAAAYSAQVDALTSGGAKGALVNIPNITSIPYFTTVPARSIPLDAATAGALNAQFGQYNTQVLPGLVQFGVITAEEAASRTINFVEGVNFPIIVDTDLTDVSGVLQGPPLNLPPATAMLLGQLRQANSSDLVVLPASSVLGSTPDPSNPQGVVGVSIPLANQFVLTSVEQERVSVAAQSYNATIQALAAANDLAFVDARSALADVAAGGVAIDGGVLTSTYVTGGAFSLDGVHPTARGYAFTTNAIIEAINKKYNATVPTVAPGSFPSVTLENNVN
ncbi:SGNH/GDSL hydrolase family protein [Patiriisocius marinus]|uniref:Outer membrane protein n=1 Tax=Patiriisocius marinus TaxID=1397112 RepID=A0A5J4ISJ4_9FLAO|nr:SGNH/GDSL hydrolase family protein [Patiriisocius marinus]GER60985.1 outer membrane protein [Patiriisocius marinus]